MKIDNFVRFSPQDYPDAPEWFEKFSRNLNHILEQIVTVLQGGITTDNENAEVLTLYLTDSALQEIRAPKVTGEIEDVQIIWAETPVDNYLWSRTADGATVTPYFRGSPTDRQLVRIKVRGA